MSTYDECDRRLESLETKAAYLEAANAELSQVVYQQQQEIDRLRARLDALIQQFADWRDASPPWTAEEEKPPHY